ncbi:COG1361 S-layer family protein [Halosolutus halophilus]|uniref:COG1361 S-layer family protein n=1 Tax=Halosolutus halophilus TaxID=1552990 RepID=UPI002234F4C6|nr:hypothetical protein [Halosolutus halophilus]
MTGQEAGSSRRRRRRTVAAGGLLLAAMLVFGGVGAATAFPAGNGVAPLQDDGPGSDTRDETPENETRSDEPPATTRADGTGVANDSSLRNETVAISAAEDDGDDVTDAPQASPSTTGPPVVQPADENVTVDVAENQSVRAGDVASIELEVTNDGDEEVTDVVVTLQPPDRSVTLGRLAAPQQTRSVYLADIGTGDTETVTVDVGAARVEPGTYPLFVTVQYIVDDDDDADGDDDDDDDDDDETVLTAGPTAIPITVTEARSFDVTPVDGDVPVDGTGVYEVRVTNDGSGTVTGVVATVNATLPLTSESPTAYVGTLEPGDSETVRFALESTSDAIETTTGVAIAIAYDAGTGERTSADPVTTPVTIVDTDETADVDSVAPFAAVAIVFVLAGIWWLRRR